MIHDKTPFGARMLLMLAVLLAACGGGRERQAETPTDTPYQGTIHISADESFRPVIDEQVRVYESNRPGTKIIVHYKPEAECFNDLRYDSIRMVIGTRCYTEAEKQFLSDSLNQSPTCRRVAMDAIAVIVNPADEDSLFTMNDIRAILTGNFNKILMPVFDGLKATSTVRFVIDSVLKGAPLSPRAMAARTSEAVIDYVAANRGVIGFIGVSWIGNPEDSSQLSFLKKVRVASIESTDKPGAFTKGYQGNIYLKRYPMVRDLYYTLKEQHKGLGYGFGNFMMGTIGQLIFKRAYLVPTQKVFGVRPVDVSD